MKNGIFLRMLIVAIAFSGLFISCVREPELLSDQRFNGKFYDDAEYYSRPILEFVFDGTTKAKMGPMSIEIQVSNGKWRYRHWNDKAKDEMEWTWWLDYNFSDDGTVLTYYGWKMDTIISNGTRKRVKIYVNRHLIKM